MVRYHGINRNEVPKKNTEDTPEQHWWIIFGLFWPNCPAYRRPIHECKYRYLTVDVSKIIGAECPREGMLSGHAIPYSDA
jgi:hypothetical protein